MDDGRGSRQGRLVGEVSSKSRCGGDIIFWEPLRLLIAVDYSNTSKTPGVFIGEAVAFVHSRSVS